MKYQPNLSFICVTLVHVPLGDSPRSKRCYGYLFGARLKVSTTFRTFRHIF